MSPAAPQRVVGRGRAEARRGRGRCGRRRRRSGAAPPRSSAIAPVGAVGARSRRRRAGTRPARARRRRDTACRPPPNFAAIQLGHEVVMVEDEARALAAQAARGQQQEVGRVAGVDDVEAARRAPAGARASGSATAPGRTRARSRAGRRRRARAGSDGSRCPRRPRTARRWRPSPCAQTTTTSQPAARSVRASFQTPPVRRDRRVLGDEAAPGAPCASGRTARRAAPRECVRSRIQMLSQTERRRAYSRSSAIISSSVSSERPSTCHRPVMPGLTAKRAEPVRRVVLDLVGDRRARPDERHVAAQHVPQLGQLVEARLAQEAADARDALVARPS